MLVITRFLAGALVGGALAACASGGSLEGAVYHNAGIGFRIGPVPEGWRRLDVADASLAFRDDANEASILVNAKCDPSDQTAPLASLTEHLIMGTTERDYRVEETIPFDAREARHTVLSAKLDGVPMTYDIFVLKKDACVYDLVYVAAPSTFERGAPAFEHFATAFHTVPGPS